MPPSMLSHRCTVLDSVLSELKHSHDSVIANYPAQGRGRTLHKVRPFETRS